MRGGGRGGGQPTVPAATNHSALSELGSRKRRHLWGRGGVDGGWRGRGCEAAAVVVGIGGVCYWVDPTSHPHPHPPPTPPWPAPSTQIEMDFGVIRLTEGFGEENERDRLLGRA